MMAFVPLLVVVIVAVFLVVIIWVTRDPVISKKEYQAALSRAASLESLLRQIDRQAAAHEALGEHFPVIVRDLIDQNLYTTKKSNNNR